MRIVISLGLALALAACGGSDGKRDGSDERAAEGEVLGGTISDDMLPLESVQSQSPPMKVEPVAATSDDGAGGAEDGADAAQGGGADMADTAEPDAADNAENNDG